MSLEDNNKSNSFFSVFNSGGKAGGGGGGEVNTASNLGTGLGTYKQKVLADLQFRSLLEGKGINLAYSISDDEIEIAQEVGIVGIGDGTGFYTFYSDINTALSSAVSGQSIKLFADIVETNPVSIVLKNNVDIDLNGFTYTLDSADATNMITDTAEVVNVTIRNGNLIRLNAVPTNTQDGVCINVSRAGSTINLDDNVYVENVGNVVLNMERGGNIIGGVFVGGSVTYQISATLNGQVSRCFFNVTQQVVNGATAISCIFYNVEENGVALYNQSGRVLLSTIISRGQNFSSGEMNECDIRNNEGSALWSQGGEVRQCSLRGRNGVAFGVSDAVLKCTSFTYVQQSSVYASSGYCVSLNESEMFNSSCVSLNDSQGVVILETEAFLFNNSLKNNQNISNRNAIIVSADDVVIVGNQLRINDTSSFGITTLGSTFNAYICSNSLYNGTLVDTSKVTNIQVNTPDLYGNIVIG